MQHLHFGRRLQTYSGEQTSIFSFATLANLNGMQPTLRQHKVPIIMSWSIQSQVK
jgi:hypothetical protein